MQTLSEELSSIIELADNIFVLSYDRVFHDDVLSYRIIHVDVGGTLYYLKDNQSNFIPVRPTFKVDSVGSYAYTKKHPKIRTINYVEVFIRKEASKRINEAFKLFVEQWEG